MLRIVHFIFSSLKGGGYLDTKSLLFYIQRSDYNINPNQAFVHFSANTFMATYLQQFFAFYGIGDKCESYLVEIQDHDFTRFIPKLHLRKVLFSLQHQNIKKAPHSMLNMHFFWCKKGAEQLGMPMRFFAQSPSPPPLPQ